FIAGPRAGTLLADMGADVVKVEPPQGDMGRATPPIRDGESVSFVALNRNKRSLVLDLKRPQAIEILLKLARMSDVVLEAYRPGALDKLGLGAAHVKAVNPRIIYTSVSGFGQSGPDRRRAGVNLIIEAFSGALSVTGEPGKMPMRPGVQTAAISPSEHPTMRFLPDSCRCSVSTPTWAMRAFPPIPSVKPTRTRCSPWSSPPYRGAAARNWSKLCSLPACRAHA